MLENTVNESDRRYPKEITERCADITDTLRYNYIECGKESDEKKKMSAKENPIQPSISLIERLRRNGEIVAETDVSASIKVYPGGKPNPNKVKSTKNKNEGFTH